MPIKRILRNARPGTRTMMDLQWQLHDPKNLSLSAMQRPDILVRQPELRMRAWEWIVANARQSSVVGREQMLRRSARAWKLLQRTFKMPKQCPCCEHAHAHCVQITWECDDEMKIMGITNSSSSSLREKELMLSESMRCVRSTWLTILAGFYSG